jgi:hypothetical protein
MIHDENPAAAALYDGSVEVAYLTSKESLHHLVDELPEDQAELARVLLEDLRNAADSSGPPLDDETLASLDRGLADIASGRVKPFDEYKRDRGL